ncbi:unnamed protein product [Gordionus sp. m RMFG-2023]
MLIDQVPFEEPTKKSIIAAQDQCKMTQEGTDIRPGQTISISSKYKQGAENIASISKCNGNLTVSIALKQKIYIQSENSKPVLINSLQTENFGLGIGPNQVIKYLKIKDKSWVRYILMGIDNRNKDDIWINVGPSSKVVNLSFKRT